jgi:prepilin-type N-terminal cleavage/methylation domain-containing protein
MSKKWHSIKGFTLIEAIMVVVIIGILATAITYRYNRSTDTDSTMAAVQLIADIQYVQMRAMGIGSSQSISFLVGSNQYSILGESGTKKLPDKEENVVILATNFGGYGNTLFFNTLGEPYLSSGSPPHTSCASLNGGSCFVSLGKNGTTYKTITVFAITGKVYVN